MPIITVDGRSTEVTADTRLLQAIIDAGVDIGHRCGGQARCTTCRVEFDSGEPTTMTAAEHRKLEERGLLGKARLSCQILASHDMTVRSVVTLQSEGWSDTGPAPKAEVEPEAAWFELQELAPQP